MFIDDYRKLIDDGVKTPEELFNDSRLNALKYQDEYNSFVTILDKFKCKMSDSILYGVPYSLKDNISTNGIKTTACSNILKNYVPVYDATVYKKLKKSGAVLVGKTVLDELAMGGTGTTGNTGVVKNPWDSSRLIGGSSAGSAASVALGITPFSIGSDTGDSIRKPAAYGGVVGYKPTYGLVSRYGLFAFASSLDHVGCFARCVKDVAYVIDIIKGKDINDMVTYDSNEILVSDIDKDVTGKRLFYFKGVCDFENYDSNDTELEKVLTKFHETIDKIKSLGIEVEEVEFPKELLNAIYPVYNTISCAEATSNNSNLTGIPFGVRGEGNSVNDIIFDARTKGFSELIKRRFVIGSYVLQRENQEKLYLNACRVRRLIVDKMNEIFNEYDGLIMPSSGSIAPKFGSADDRLSDKYLILENHLDIGNFGGFPSISLPSGFVDDMPVSINITSKPKNDKALLNIAYKIEEVLGYKGIMAGDKNV